MYVTNKQLMEEIHKLSARVEKAILHDTIIEEEHDAQLTKQAENALKEARTTPLDEYVDLNDL